MIVIVMVLGSVGSVYAGTVDFGKGGSSAGGKAAKPNIINRFKGGTTTTPTASGTKKTQPIDYYTYRVGNNYITTDRRLDPTIKDDRAFLATQFPGQDLSQTKELHFTNQELYTSYSNVIFKTDSKETVSAATEDGTTVTSVTTYRDLDKGTYTVTTDASGKETRTFTDLKGSETTLKDGVKLNQDGTTWSYEYKDPKTQQPTTKSGFSNPDDAQKYADAYQASQSDANKGKGRVPSTYTDSSGNLALQDKKGKLYDQKGNSLNQVVQTTLDKNGQVLYNIDPKTGKKTFDSATITAEDGGTLKLTNEQAYKDFSSSYSKGDTITKDENTLTISRDDKKKLELETTDTGYKTRSGFDEEGNFGNQKTFSTYTSDLDNKKYSSSRTETFETVYTVDGEEVDKKTYDSAESGKGEPFHRHTSDIENKDVPDGNAGYNVKETVTTTYDKDKTGQETGASTSKGVDSLTGAPMSYETKSEGGDIIDSARYDPGGNLEVYDQGTWRRYDEERDGGNEVASDLKSDRGAYDRAEWIQTSKASPFFWLSLANQYNVAGFISGLFMDKDDMEARRKEVDEFFCNTIIGGDVACWTSKVCDKQYDKEIDGILYTIGPSGMLEATAGVQGEKTTLTYPNETTGEMVTEYLYKYTFHVKAYTEDLKFSVVVSGPGGKKFLLQDKKLDGDEEGDGDTYYATNENAIIEYSKVDYTKICIDFEDGPLNVEGDEVDHVCNKISPAAIPIYTKK